jgi:DNA-directed RNA polymerase subunit F
VRNTPRKILSVKTISIPETKKILEKASKEELGEFQRRTLEYAKKSSKVKPEKAGKLIDELGKKFQIERADGIQIANCMPRTIEELRSVLAVKGRVIVSTQLEEILKVVDEYREES